VRVGHYPSTLNEESASEPDLGISSVIDTDRYHSASSPPHKGGEIRLLFLRLAAADTSQTGAYQQ
jgi:hypothetical protein